MNIKKMKLLLTFNFCLMTGLMGDFFTAVVQGMETLNFYDGFDNSGTKNTMMPSDYNVGTKALQDVINNKPNKEEKLTFDIQQETESDAEELDQNKKTITRKKKQSKKKVEEIGEDEESEKEVIEEPKKLKKKMKASRFVQNDEESEKEVIEEPKKPKKKMKASRFVQNDEESEEKTVRKKPKQKTNNTQKQVNKNVYRNKMSDVLLQAYQIGQLDRHYSDFINKYKLHKISDAETLCNTLTLRTINNIISLYNSANETNTEGIIEPGEMKQELTDPNSQCNFSRYMAEQCNFDPFNDSCNQDTHAAILFCMLNNYIRQLHEMKPVILDIIAKFIKQNMIVENGQESKLAGTWFDNLNQRESIVINREKSKQKVALIKKIEVDDQQTGKKKDIQVLDMENVAIALAQDEETLNDNTLVLGLSAKQRDYLQEYTNYIINANAIMKKLAKFCKEKDAVPSLQALFTKQWINKYQNKYFEYLCGYYEINLIDEDDKIDVSKYISIDSDSISNQFNKTLAGLNTKKRNLTRPDLNVKNAINEEEGEEEEEGDAGEDSIDEENMEESDEENSVKRIDDKTKANQNEEKVDTNKPTNQQRKIKYFVNKLPKNKRK